MDPKLYENEFYRKKLRRAVEVRDADKNGLITRLDFELVVQRHKDLGAPEEHIKRITVEVNKFCNSVGLTDNSVSMTYEEFGDIYVHKMDKGEILFLEIFHTVDINGDGEISYEEWVHYYKIIGINTAHARASFDAMNTEGNGKVSVEEFVAYHKEYYQSAEDKLNSSILYGPLQ